MRLVDRPPMLRYVLAYPLMSTPTVAPAPHRVISIGGESTRRANVQKQHISNPGVGVGGGITSSDVPALFERKNRARTRANY